MERSVTFTPISYKFCHCAEYVSPAEDSWAGYDNLNMIDTETVTFDAADTEQLYGLSARKYSGVHR